MKILSVTAQRPDSTGSGIYLRELINGFSKLGHRQAVLAGIGADEEMPFASDIISFPVRYESDELPFPILGMSDQMPYRSTRYSSMTDEMTALFRTAFGKQIQNAIRSFDPDVILCHHLYYLTALFRELCPDRKIFAVSHGSDLRQIRKNPWQRDYIRGQISELDGIFALHEEQKKVIQDIFPIKKEKVSVIGTGYNSRIFHIIDSPDAAKEQSTDKNRIKLLFAGKIDEKKGIFSLMKSLELLDQPDRYIISFAGGYGDINEYTRLQKAAETSPVEVRFLGKLPQDELAREMNRNDIFILPSFYEGLPLVLIEAMACGLRVVCTDLPGIKDWLNACIPDNGVVFVTPPEMINQDEPTPESLPRFERDLAAAIHTAETAQPADPSAVSAVSWDSLCLKLLSCFLI